MQDKREDIQAKGLSSIHEVDAQDWDICAGNNNPFISHAFLSSLEDSHSTGIEVGWMPKHIVIEDSNGCILDATTLYIKIHLRLVVCLSLKKFFSLFYI